jgi:hypothetical protein
VLSTRLGNLESLQFGAAFLAETRSRSIASLLIRFRYSENLLFGAKHAPTIRTGLIPISESPFNGPAREFRRVEAPGLFASYAAL